MLLHTNKLKYVDLDRVEGTSMDMVKSSHKKRHKKKLKVGEYRQILMRILFNVDGLSVDEADSKNQEFTDALLAYSVSSGIFNYTHNSLMGGGGKTSTCMYVEFDESKAGTDEAMIWINRFIEKSTFKDFYYSVIFSDLNWDF